MNEVPLHTRLAYVRATGKNLPTGIEGVLELERILNGRSVLRRTILIEKIYCKGGTRTC